MADFVKQAEALATLYPVGALVYHVDLCNISVLGYIFGIKFGVFGVKRFFEPELYSVILGLDWGLSYHFSFFFLSIQDSLFFAFSNDILFIFHFKPIPIYKQGHKNKTSNDFPTVLKPRYSLSKAPEKQDF